MDEYVNKLICKIKGHDWKLEKDNDYTRNQCVELYNKFVR